MRTSWFSFSVALCLCLFGISCAMDIETALQNSWKEIGGNYTVEFYRDGTFIVYNREYRRKGTYEFIAEKRIRVSTSELFGLFTSKDILKVSIRGNKLVLETLDGEVSEFVKSK